MKPMSNSKPFVLVIVIVPFLGTVLAIGSLWQRAIQWSDLALLVTMYTLTAFGLTIGYHRMLTHRSFRAHPVVKVILLVLGAMAVASPPIEFAAIHIKHHAQSDREGDPHSPLEGLFHAHLGWLFKDRFADPQVYCRHLLKDAIVVFVNRSFLLWVALSLGLPFAIGGWTGLLWGGLVRIFLVHHFSFSVNSICHTFGRREFETNDRSRNQWLVAVLAFGEGWHNNHHAFPRSAFHGLHWWQLDLSGYVIWTLERLGLAHEVYRVSPTLLARSSLARSSSRKDDPVSDSSLPGNEAI
jgi:stearoyl-CoA desaturase (delta-9 desaturase)